MKKRTMAVGGLLLAVAMTGYSVAGTYAKYVSQIDLTDEVRIAKWDITAINTEGEVINTLDLFADSYSLNDKGVYVKSVDGDNVLAPGTKGEYQVNFAGDMEVRYMLDIALEGPDYSVPYYLNAKGQFDKNDLDEGYGEYRFGQLEDGTWGTVEPTGIYSPIVYTVTFFNGFKSEEYFKFTGTLEEINNQIADYAKTDAAKAGFEPGQLGLSLKIEWQWDTITGFADDFDYLNKDNKDVKNSQGLTAIQVNQLDTYMGKEYVTGSNHDYDTDEFTITVTATQVAEDHAERTN